MPYKTLLLSVSDSAAAVVVEMLQKYGKYREDPADFCLVQVSSALPDATGGVCAMFGGTFWLRCC